MDVLIVIGQQAAPARLVSRAHHVVHIPDGTPSPELVADLRPRIPREVAIVGPIEQSAAIALALHRDGFPVSVHTDEQIARADELAKAGIEVRTITDPGAPIEAVDSLLDLIGNTPLVRLDRIARDLPCQVLAKLELLNPGGSVKDRIAASMIDAAEEAGLLKPGGTIVEPTSGNTGVGLAIVAARRRYRCVFVMPDKMSQEKINLLRAYGAEVVVCPTAVAPEHPDSYYSVADRLAAEIPGAYRPDQYSNPQNPLSHYRTTGPEIWRQTSGRITHLVVAIGTGGTISGTGRYLKEQNPTIKIIGADPEGSVYSGGTGRPYLVEGIGEDFWPKTYDKDLIDQVIAVSDRDSFLTARRVTREEGILVGGSAGTAIHAALVLGEELGPDDVVVTLIPDSGRGYISKLYNDQWMSEFGFLRTSGETVGDVLTRKGGTIPTLVHVHPDETVRSTIALMKEFNVSQVPVVKAELPLAVAEVVGSARERLLLESVFANGDVLDRPVSEIMAPPLPTVGSGEPVDIAVSTLEADAAILVVDAGHPVGILTRSDILEFLSQRGR